MNDFAVDVIGRSPEGVTDADLAACDDLLDDWSRQRGAGTAIVADIVAWQIDVLATVDWNWTGAAPVGVWAVLALAMRLSREFPEWTWTVSDEALGDRSLLMDALFSGRHVVPSGSVSMRRGRLSDVTGLRKGMLWPLTCYLLERVDEELGLAEWIGVRAADASAAMKRKLQDLIRAAFADERYPGDAAVDCFWPETTDYFRGRHWSGNTVRDLRYHSEALSYLPPAGFRFFLPAFMLAELEDPEEADVIAGSIAFHLNPRDNDSFARERAALLSGAQRKAVVAFFDYLEARYATGDVWDAIALLDSDQSESGSA